MVLSHAKTLTGRVEGADSCSFIKPILPTPPTLMSSKHRPHNGVNAPRRAPFPVAGQFGDPEMFLGGTQRISQAVHCVPGHPRCVVLRVVDVPGIHVRQIRDPILRESELLSPRCGPGPRSLSLVPASLRRAMAVLSFPTRVVRPIPSSA